MYLIQLLLLSADRGSRTLVPSLEDWYTSLFSPLCYTRKIILRKIRRISCFPRMFYSGGGSRNLTYDEILAVTTVFVHLEGLEPPTPRLKAECSRFRSPIRSYRCNCQHVKELSLSRKNLVVLSGLEPLTPGSSGLRSTIGATAPKF